MIMRRMTETLYKGLTIVVLLLCLFGAYSFVTAPPKAYAARLEIENMLRENQRIAAEMKVKRLKQITAAKYSSVFKGNKITREEVSAAGSGQTIIPAALRYNDAREMYVVGIGDSVMLSGLNALYEEFPNGYFDAVFGRTIYEGMNVLYKLEKNDQLGDVLVFSLGTNCYIQEEDCEELIRHSGGRPTFWISTVGVANDSNDVMKRVIDRHPDAYMIDWTTPAMQNHSRYILPDALHLTTEGSYAYAELIADVITEKMIDHD